MVLGLATGVHGYIGYIQLNVCGKTSKLPERQNKNKDKLVSFAGRRNEYHLRTITHISIFVYGREMCNIGIPDVGLDLTRLGASSLYVFICISFCHLFRSSRSHDDHRTKATTLSVVCVVIVLFRFDTVEGHPKVHDCTIAS